MRDRITSFRDGAKNRMTSIGLTPAQAAEAQRQIDLAYKQYVNPDYRVAPNPGPIDPVVEAARTLRAERGKKDGAGN